MTANTVVAGTIGKSALNKNLEECALCLSKTSKRLSGRELYFFPNSLLR